MCVFVGADFPCLITEEVDSVPQRERSRNIWLIRNLIETREKRTAAEIHIPSPVTISEIKEALMTIKKDFPTLLTVKRSRVLSSEEIP